jgi:hypothetical protein
MFIYLSFIRSCIEQRVELKVFIMEMGLRIIIFIVIVIILGIVIAMDL